MKNLLLGIVVLTGFVGLALPLQAFPREGDGAGYRNWRGASGTFQRSGSYENSRGGSGTFSNSVTHQPGSTTGTRSWTNSRGTGSYTFNNNWDKSTGTGTHSS